MKKILIFGCGWVGIDVALYFQNQGFEVWVTTTNSEKQDEFLRIGLKAIVHDFDQDVSLTGIPPEFECILTSVPASSKNSLEVIQQRFGNINQVLKKLKFKKHIYLSSIGIYPDEDGTFNESCQNKLNQRLLIAENFMTDIPDSYIFRLGGLFGKSRVFAKYFANKVCSTGLQPANFVHIDDVVNMITLAFATPIEFGIYNVVSPEHPTKEAVIRASALKYGYALPLSFEKISDEQKFVDGAKIIAALDYTFKYPSPLNF